MAQLEEFISLYQRVAKNVGLSTSRTSDIALAKDWTNRAYLDFNGKFPWPWALNRFSFQTVPNKTAGTVSVTQGSRTVTGSGTAFSTDDEGQVFLLKNEKDNKYIILKVNSSTELLLEQPYTLESKSDQLYIIHHKYYILASEAQNVYDMYVERDKLRYADLRDFDAKFPDSQERGIPLHWTRWGRDYKIRTHSAGTITIEAESRTVIGVSTNFLGNVQPGDLIIATETYHVKSVDSDTQISLIEIVTTDRTNVSYTSESKAAPIIWIDGAPVDITTIEYLYKRRTYPMQGDTECPNVDRQFLDAIVSGGVLYGYQYLDDDRQQSQKALFELQIRDAVAFYDSSERPDAMEWAEESFIDGDEVRIR